MSQAEAILAGLGGWDNITALEACITRIRAEVTDDKKVNDTELKDTGAFGVVKVGHIIQVVVGPEAENLVADIESLK